MGNKELSNYQRLMNHMNNQFEPDIPLLVESKPLNYFNFSYNVGYFFGSAAGLVVAYFGHGKIFPGFKKLVGRAFYGKCKMAFVVNDSLRMSKGMTARQVSTGAILAYEKFTMPHRSWRRGLGALHAWNSCGQAKVVCRAPDHQTLLQLEKKAKVAKLSSVLVYQNPHEMEVLVVGPGPLADIDSVTGGLRLL